MSSTFPQRVAFEDHRFMQAIDLEDEQLYHLQRRWQHNLSLHSWGILCGLEVRINGTLQQQPNVVIYPGMALDGYGRELVVTNLLSVLESFHSFNPEITYDVWVTYGFSLYDNATGVGDCSLEGLDDCDPPPDTNLHRIVEQPQVIVRATSERQSGSVTQPREVPIGDLFFTPDRPMKFDPSTQWPVFLCKLQFIGNAWTVDSTERHYGGLIAERIEMPFQTVSEGDPPKRQTSIMNGGHPDRRDWRFAVLDIPAPKADNQATNTKDKRDHTKTLPDDVPAPLSIRAVPVFDGKQTTTETEIRWQAERVVAEADLVMRGGAGIQFEATPPGEIPFDPTSGWGIFRQFRPPTSNTVANVRSQSDPQSTTTTFNTSVSTKPKDANTDQFADVLQISMPQNEQGKNSVAVGAVDADGKFSPILVVNNDESVDIFGMLRVHGTIYGETTDLPPLDTATAHEFFRKWLIEQLHAGDQEGKSFVQVIAQNVQPDVFRDGLESTEDGQERKLYTAIAANIIKLMPQDNGGVGDTFAKGFAAAIALPSGALDSEQRNFYIKLAANIIKLMPQDNGGVGDTFAEGFAAAIALPSGALDSEQRNFYIKLAANIIKLMPQDNGGVGDTFAEGFAAAIALPSGASDSEQRNFYTKLAANIIKLMPQDNGGIGDTFAKGFAAAIALPSGASDSEQRNFYTKLAANIIKLMPQDNGGVGDTFAKGFAAAIALPSGASDSEQRNFYTKLAANIIKLMPQDNGGVGDTFAEGFAAAIALPSGASDSEQRNFYTKLAANIIKLMPQDNGGVGDTFAKGFAAAIALPSGASDSEQRNFYTKLAANIIKLMPQDNGGVGDTFAEGFAAAIALPSGTSDSEQRNFYTKLAANIIKLMPQDNGGVGDTFAEGFAAAIALPSGASDSEQRNFYTKLAANIIKLMPQNNGGGHTFAEGFAKAIAGANKVSEERTFYKALAKQIVALMKDTGSETEGRDLANAFFSILPGSVGLDAFFNALCAREDLMQFIWSTKESATLLGKNFNSANVAEFRAGLDAISMTATLKTALS